MPRYVNVDLLKAEFTGNFTKAYAVPLIKSIIDNAPTADVEEIRHGKWIYEGYYDVRGHAFQCSACGRWMFTDFPKHVVEEQPYCHCGAKLDGVEGLEDEE